MSLRVLLAVVLTVALVASAAPAIETAQQARADHRLSSAADRIQTNAEALARHSDPVPLGVPAGRRLVRVDLPEDPPGGNIRIGNVSDEAGSVEGNAIVTQVPDGPRSIHPVGVPLLVQSRPDDAGAGDTLVLREDGYLRLAYRLVDGEPVVVVSRGFKSGNRTSQAHAGTSGTGA